MNQNTIPAPFNVGDHVRYTANPRRTVPAGKGTSQDLVLTPGMEGVVVLSTGALSPDGAAAPNPWRCQVQFPNGFQLDITPENYSDFTMTKDLLLAAK